MSAADILLPRLERVRQTKAGSWVARCPAHTDKSPSLAITETSDGTILLHDFAGCSPSDILAAVGLELRDLFPERIKDTSPEGRRQARAAFKQSAWAAALRTLAREATVVLVAAGMLRHGEAMTPEDDARLNLAMQRIDDARAVLA